MHANLLSAFAIAVSYLIGAIPFAYVFVRVAKGVDIRTVGSGNVGATNASRVLGLRGFLLVFLCDLLKGLIPTLALPAIVKWRIGEISPALPILVALAAILGHNFPIYLGFRGGKGVSTSLGAAIGLDWMASIVAIVVFAISLRISKYVSLSSMLGATCFAIAHYLVVVFYERKSPWDRDHLALTMLILGLVLMLLVRHRKNWGRILDGTEPKISRKRAPSGRVRVVVLALIALAGIGAIVAQRISRREVSDCGDFTLAELTRVRTGHQRAIRPVFADHGSKLAVLCPRYNRLMIYDVSPNDSLTLRRDVTLDGQPMDLVRTNDRFWVLERPSGDERHIKPGYVQSYSFDGAKLGTRIELGFYPSEFVATSNGKTAIALTLGETEGEKHHGPASLYVLDLNEPRLVSQLKFDRAKDGPRHLSISSSGQAASVVLPSEKAIAAIDLTSSLSPAVIGRMPLSNTGYPYLSLTKNDAILLPADSADEAAVMTQRHPRIEREMPYLLAVNTEESQIEIRNLITSNRVGRLQLYGAANFGEVRPTGVAFSPERNLIAVSNRSGGVHLVAVRAKTVETASAHRSSVATR